MCGDQTRLAGIAFQPRRPSSYICGDSFPTHHHHVEFWLRSQVTYRYQIYPPSSVKRCTCPKQVSPKEHSPKQGGSRSLVQKESSGLSLLHETNRDSNKDEVTAAFIGAPIAIFAQTGENKVFVTSRLQELERGAAGVGV
ncbi:hypothetical protein M5K25_002007 [Dendrobium thyrsiflorum]|uniref:Uncharacterized protein n=1 Tax=Dendrobium thyrsiflorum TaxID=117978 RepID=A0ABD0VSA8_DENTH